MNYHFFGGLPDYKRGLLAVGNDLLDDANLEISSATLIKFTFLPVYVTMET